MNIEGQAASCYWSLIKLLLSKDVYFEGRERRGAADLVNSLLNYGYGILYSQVYQSIILAGLNPNISFLHKEQIGKPTLVFDLIEEFRQPVVDKAVIGMIRKKQKLTMEGTNLTQESKTRVVKNVLRRLDSFVKFRGKRLTLREIMNYQANFLVNFLEGKGKYHPFIDRW
jgi:CRISPR-associated protein Cas1